VATATECPVCWQDVTVYDTGLIKKHKDTAGGRCPMSERPLPEWNEARTRPAVEARSGGICEFCQRAKAVEKAHRIGRGVGGDWDPGNIVDLCSRCHRESHRNPDWANLHGLILKSWEDPETTPVTRLDGTQFQPTREVVMMKGRRA
jgi:hypothetical protein